MVVEGILSNSIYMVEVCRDYIYWFMFGFDGDCNLF